MTIPASANPLLLASAAAGGYAIERSVRFNSSDSAYLSRTPASAGNRKTWTWAGWVKRSDLSTSDLTLFSGGTTFVHTATTIIFFHGNKLCYSSVTQDILQTEAVYRDASAWYHIVVALDTTQATASNRLKFYVNGSQVTQFSTDARSAQLAQNTDYGINNTGAHEIGRFAYGSNKYFNGYLTDIHFIDGQALDPTSFGEFDDNGIWQPIEYTGTCGTNGFHLDFSDNSTAAALGTDTSGNGNTWTVNNISVAAGAGNDSLVDVPTNDTETDTGLGNEVRGNYATLNPLALTAHTLANGNLDVSSSAIGIAVGTVAMSTGKWYWEITLNTVSANVSPVFGYINQSFNTATAGTTYLGSGANNGGVRRDNGQAFQNNTSTSYTGAAGFSAGDVAMVAFDADAKKMWVGKNGTWYNSGDPGAGTGQIPLTITGTAFFPAFNTYGDNWTINFGQRAFAHNVSRSGFKALCTANLPAPVVTKPSSVFDVKLYTGDDGTQTISGLGFSPDLVWIKCRGVQPIVSHVLTDTVRGAALKLASNTTGAEAGTDNGYLSAFTSDGFTVAQGGGPYPGLETNESPIPYVAWTWDAGSSTVTNTDGSITSQVRANASAGFSIVTVDNVTNGTFGHGLGVAPAFAVVKSRSATGGWAVYHSSLGATKYLFLHTTDAATTSSGPFANTAPTSSVISLGSWYTGGTLDVVAYCFAPVESYSAFGSYIGNGSTDGPFVFTNHRPRWILLKRTDTTSNWTIIDTAREGYNVDNDPLYPNLSNAEGTTDLADILSNGFKLRSTDASVNANSGTYIYASFAEQPFSLARAR